VHVHVPVDILVFAKFMFKLSDVNNTDIMNIRCKQVLKHERVHGHIVEIGSGTGINFPCLYNNSRIQSYIGIEPNVHMHKYFHEFIQQYPRTFNTNVHNYSAVDMHEIPSDSIDTVIMTFVFCSIPDPLPEQALHEIHRILKRNGEFHFIEHIQVNVEQRPFAYVFQRLIEPIWSIVGDGCQFKPMTNYFDGMKSIYSHVSYEKSQLPVPLFFVKDAIKGRLIK
jgi:ubiquinone/menaquinone biosynthesis C-methylase UbiE